MVIDIGTKKLKVFIKGRGVVFSQACAVAWDKSFEKIVAVGDEAYEMMDRTPESIEIHQPIKAGMISDYSTMKWIFEYLIEKYRGKAVLKPDLMVIVPSSISDLDKKTIIDLACVSGAGKVCIVEEPVASAYGCCMDVERPFGTLVVDIGAGTTDIAVITMNSIAASATLPTGGNDLDEAITQYIFHKKNFLIGCHTAEKIKNTIGSAKETGEMIELFEGGKNAINGLPETFSVTTKEINEAITPVLNRIMEGIRSVMEEIPAEMYTDICNSGIYLTGGVASLRHIKECFEDYFGIDAIICADGEHSAVKGGGYLLSRLDEFENQGLIFKIRHQNRFVY